jgi:hypothetical protein
MLTAGPPDQLSIWRRSRRRLSMCSVFRCPDLRLQCKVNFVHCLKYIIIVWCVFFNPCTKLTLHCNRKSGHLKTGHTGSLLLLRRHLENCSRGQAVSMRSELLVAHENLRQFQLLTVYVVPVYCEKLIFYQLWNCTILLCMACTGRHITSSS